MINNSSIEKWERLIQKQQNVQFINRLQAGLNYSPFEAKAILNCVYEVYQPFFDNSSSMKPGEKLFEVVAVENSAKGKLSNCQIKTVVLPLDADAYNFKVQESEGIIVLRWHRLQLITTEAFQKMGLLTMDDVENRLLNCGDRTLAGDMEAFKEKNISQSLTSTIKNMGCSIRHRQMIVKNWSWVMELSNIWRKTNHCIEAIVNDVDKFKRVIYIAMDKHKISTIASLVKIYLNFARRQLLSKCDYCNKIHNNRQITAIRRQNRRDGKYVISFNLRLVGYRQYYKKCITLKTIFYDK